MLVPHHHAMDINRAAAANAMMMKIQGHFWYQVRDTGGVGSHCMILSPPWPVLYTVVRPYDAKYVTTVRKFAKP